MFIAELGDPERFESTGRLRGRVSRTQTRRQASAEEFVAQSGRESAVTACFMDADARHPEQSLADGFLSSADRPRQASQGRSVRGEAQIGSGHLLRRQTPPPFQQQPKPTVGGES